MRVVAVILAGGKGERLWPKSRESIPKQFITLPKAQETLIQQTIRRIKDVARSGDIYVITNERYSQLAKEQLPDIPKDNILSEPEAKNTAPCIGMAMMYIKKKYKDAVCIVVPADHVIKDEKQFVKTLNEGIKGVADDNLITIGVQPTYPEVGYGYIQYATNKEKTLCKVIKFTEKPARERAEIFLKEGNYLWNSGVYIWKLEHILSLFKKYLTHTYTELEKIYEAIGTGDEQRVLHTAYKKIKPISIDYGIMEHATGVYVIKGEFEWSDAGSWQALESIYEADEANNVIAGNVVYDDMKNSVVEARERLVALIGVEDLIVVDTDDVVLICKKEKAQDIKNILKHLRENNLEEYL